MLSYVSTTGCVHIYIYTNIERETYPFHARTGPRQRGDENRGCHHRHFLEEDGVGGDADRGLVRPPRRPTVGIECGVYVSGTGGDSRSYVYTTHLHARTHRLPSPSKGTHGSKRIEAAASARASSCLCGIVDLSERATSTDRWTHAKQGGGRRQFNRSTPTKTQQDEWIAHLYPAVEPVGVVRHQPDVVVCCSVGRIGNPPGA